MLNMKYTQRCTYHWYNCVAVCLIPILYIVYTIVESLTSYLCINKNSYEEQQSILVAGDCLVIMVAISLLSPCHQLLESDVMSLN